MRQECGEAAGGPAKHQYPTSVVEKYSQLCFPPLNLPTTIPDNYYQGLPDDITLTRICQLVHLLITDAPNDFHNVVDEWSRRETEREQQRINDDMARYGRTYKEPAELIAHLGSRLTFERMLKEALALARAKGNVSLSTPGKSWRSPAPLTPLTDSRTRGSRDGDESECCDSEDERRLREVSPSPLRRPPTPISNTVSPIKRSIGAHLHIDSAKRCRSTLERLVSPPKSTVPPLDTFPPFDLEAWSSSSTSRVSSRSTITSAFTSTSSSRSALTTSSSSFLSERPRAREPPITSPESIAEQVSPDETSDPKTWRPLPALDESERTVLVTPINPYQKLIWIKDIKPHVQWEVERLVAQDPLLTWGDFVADDLSGLVGEVLDVMPRVGGILGAIKARIDNLMLACEDSHVDPPISPLDGDASSLTTANLAINGIQTRTTSSDSMVSYSAAHMPVTDTMKRLYAEVDREEMSIRAQDGKGMLSEDRDWLFGGKIAYTVYVSLAPINRNKRSEGNARVQLYPPKPDSPVATATITMQEQQASIFSKGPIDEPHNLLGPASQVKQHTVSPYLPFTMSLAPPKMSGKSFRLARMFGSRRVLNFKFKDMKTPKQRQHMFELFAGRQFALFGRIYRALWAPADKSAIFAIEVSDKISGLTCPANIRKFDPDMPAYLEIFKSFNDLEMKAGQAMAKWASRPQLLFTDSVPAVKLDPASIGIIDDLFVGNLSGPASTEQTLTDGCGLMTEAIARQIGIRLDCQSGRPCVVQIRLGGAKGLLVLMTPEQELLFPGKSVLLRKSMIKSLTNSPDPSLHIIDVVKVGENVLKIPAGLSAEATIALSHRGVHRSILVEMAKLSLYQLRDQFLPDCVGMEDLNGMRQRLVAGLYGQGGVGVDRKKRLCLQEAKSAKVAGLIYDEQDPWDLPESGISDATKDDIDPSSGQPSSLAECLMMAIDAGFDPRTSAYVSAKLHYFMDQQIQRITKDFRIPVEQSLSAFIIPDPCGVLGPNEIYVACDSKRPINSVTGCTMSHILGPVLAYRSPCKLPSDVRKFNAVYKTELRHLTDCVVMSASPACSQSPASFLAGGDYDGDTATIIFDQALVKPFVQAADDIANVPVGFEEENFGKELVQGTDFLEALNKDPSGLIAGSEGMIRNYQTFLLGAVSDEPIAGLYSIWHDNAVYKYGHDHPITIRLARMFSLVLDARKSGLRVRKEIFDKDRLEHSGTIAWRAHRKGQVDDGKSMPVIRNANLPTFIMDRLLSVNEIKGKQVLRLFPLQPKHYSRDDYDDLSCLRIAKQKQVDKHGWPYSGQQLIMIEKHVAVCKEIWDRIQQERLPKNHSIPELYVLGKADAIIPQGARTPSRDSPTKSKTGRPENVSKEKQKQQLAKVWHDNLGVDEVDVLCAEPAELKRLKVSFAADATAYKQKQTFPFDMDFTTTLQMKAERIGPTSTILLDSMLGKKPTWRAEKK